MKPPHGNKPGGTGRPPSNRGPNSGGGIKSFGGGSGEYRGPRPQGPRAPRDGGPSVGPARTDGQRPQGPHAEGPRIERPRQEGSWQKFPNPNGPRANGPRPNGPRPSGPRPDAAPRPEGTRGAYIDGQRIEPRDLPARGVDTPKGAVWLYGHHAIAAALANPRRRLRRLMLTAEAEATIAQLIPPPWALQPERTERARLDQLLGRDIAHQGAALLADTLAQPGLQDVLERTGPIVVLDQVTDPRNVGAIMRSAAAFGAAAVITQDRNAPEETGSLAKAASGTLETMPLLRAVNIARTLIALKAANVWCVGLDAGGKVLSGPFFAGRRVALVLGAEGEGLRRLTRETCDEVAGLSIKGAVESLNVSAAAAVALYELTRSA